MVLKFCQKEIKNRKKLKRGKTNWNKIKKKILTVHNRLVLRVLCPFFCFAFIYFFSLLFFSSVEMHVDAVSRCSCDCSVERRTEGSIQCRKILILAVDTSPWFWASFTCHRHTGWPLNIPDASSPFLTRTDANSCNVPWISNYTIGK